MVPMAVAAVRPLLLPLLWSLMVGGALSQDTSNSNSDAEYCAGLSADARIVSTAGEASTLGEDLRRCPGLDFNVLWRGSLLLEAPLELTNATTLRVEGESKEASVIDGGGAVTLFVASGLSKLHLESLGLTGGYGDNGGAVEAYGGALVTCADCNVYRNSVASNGGKAGVYGGGVAALLVHLFDLRRCIGNLES